MGAVAAAVAGLVTLVVSAWQWNAQQTQSRLVRIEERADKALAALGDKEASARLGAAESLRSFLTQPDELRHNQVLASMTNAMAIEPEITVRNAIIAVLQSIDPHVVSKASLDAALVSLRSVSRTLIVSGSINRDHPRMQHPLRPPATESTEGRAQSVGFAMAALLHLGAKAGDLSSIYCVGCDLTNLNLEGAIFDDSILYLANFEMSRMKGASFNRADIEQVRFVDTDLRFAKFTFKKSQIPADYRKTYVLMRLEGENKVVYQPDFTCANFSHADFYGFPLFDFISKITIDYVDTSLFVLQSVFVRTNLNETDFRYIRQFGSMSQAVDTAGHEDFRAETAAVPFGMCSGVGIPVEKNGKRFQLYEYTICDTSNETKDWSQFKTSIQFIYDNFAESTWMNANYPSGLLNTLKARVGGPVHVRNADEEPPPACHKWPISNDQ